MSNMFRISTINGLLLALYFVPAWTSAAMKIVIFPIRGLYDRANIGPAIFFTDYFHMFAVGTVRFAWLLAVAKLLVVAFFAVFALLVVVAALRKSGDADEALVIAIGLGIALSFVSMIVASMVGEAAAVRLHATETLMLLGGQVLVAIDRPRATAPAEVIAAAHGI
jgi:hypothetical protein